MVSKAKEHLVTISETYSIFPTISKDKINFLGYPIRIQNDCKKGLWKIEDNLIGDSIEFAIVGLNKYYGTWGKRKQAEWLQVFFVPALSGSKLKKNVVYSTYLKSAGMENLLQLIAQNCEPEDKLGEQIFIGSFKEKDDYSYPVFSLRVRTEEEQVQMGFIYEFLAEEAQDLHDPFLVPTMFKYTTNAELEDAKVQLQIVEDQIQKKLLEG